MAKNKNKTQETGRSMVEMLGVLAVIGVLSITGISGYTTAMNKHKANEILDAASKRAVAVSTQIQRGNTSPTLDEFETNTVQGATFGTPVILGNQFKLPFDTEPSAEIKAQIKNIAGDGTGNVLIDSDVTRFLYNNDLSNGVSNTNNRDTNDATKCATGYKGTDCDTCDTDYGMHDGSCVQCPSGSSTASTHTGGNVTGYTGCKCEANKNWDATLNSNQGGCKSAVPTEYTAGNYGTHVSLTENGSGCNSSQGWHWATKSELDDMKTAGNYPSSGDTNSYWLATCYNNDCSFGLAWYVPRGGDVYSNDRNYYSLASSALCVR